MRNLKIVIEYDGTRYKGWQKQKEGTSTIQYKLESVLSKMTGEDIQVIGCGRTDAGVHAQNYIANFHTNCNLTNDTILDYLYEFLPEDIVVKSISDAHERFHARYNAKAKTYVYTINNTKYRNVFNRKFVYHCHEELNVTAMKQGAEFLIGTHDFQSYTSLKKSDKSTIRTINYIDITEKDGVIQLEFNGDGFLLNMVRIMVGTLIDVGKGELKPVDVEKILLQKRRCEAGPIAQSKGLSLKNVQY